MYTKKVHTNVYAFFHLLIYVCARSQTHTFIQTQVHTNIMFVHLCTRITLKLTLRRCSRGVMVKGVDCGIVVSEFVLQSRNYVLFRAITLGKGMNPLILPAIG